MNHSPDEHGTCEGCGERACLGALLTSMLAEAHQGVVARTVVARLVFMVDENGRIKFATTLDPQVAAILLTTMANRVSRGGTRVASDTMHLM